MTTKKLLLLCISYNIRDALGPSILVLFILKVREFSRTFHYLIWFVSTTGTVIILSIIFRRWVVARLQGAAKRYLTSAQSLRVPSKVQVGQFPRPPLPSLSLPSPPAHFGTQPLIIITQLRVLYTLLRQLGNDCPIFIRVIAH